MTHINVDAARSLPRSAGTASAANEHHQLALRKACGFAAPHCDAPEPAFALNGRSVSCPARAGLLQFVAGQPSTRLAALDHPFFDCAETVKLKLHHFDLPFGSLLDVAIPKGVVERLNGSDGWRGKPPTNPPAARAACENLGSRWISGSPHPSHASQGAGEISGVAARRAKALRRTPDSALIARAGSLLPLSRHACERYRNSKRPKVVVFDDFRTPFPIPLCTVHERTTFKPLSDNYRTTF